MGLPFTDESRPCLFWIADEGSASALPRPNRFTRQLPRSHEGRAFLSQPPPQRAMVARSLPGECHAVARTVQYRLAQRSGLERARTHRTLLRVHHTEVHRLERAWAAQVSLLGYRPWDEQVTDGLRSLCDEPVVFYIPKNSFPPDRQLLQSRTKTLGIEYASESAEPERVGVLRTHTFFYPFETEYSRQLIDCVVRGEVVSDKPLSLVYESKVRSFGSGSCSGTRGSGARWRCPKKECSNSSDGSAGSTDLEG